MNIGNFGLLYIYTLDRMGNDLLSIIIIMMIIIIIIIIIIICNLSYKCILKLIPTGIGPP